MNQQSRVISADAAVAGFTAREFLHMLECGAFDDMRVELVGGVIEKMLPAFMNHGEANASIAARLIQALQGTGYRVATDLIIGIDDSNVRAADIAVAAPSIEGDRAARGDELLLAVEIAETTLPRDIGLKRADYARAGIRNYWIVDLKAQAVHVMAVPEGTDYREVRVVRFGEPLAVPETNQTITIG
jgi:Uma2 family endonuclease